MRSGSPRDTPHLLSWRPASVATVFAIWTGLTALSASSTLMAFRRMGRPIPAWELIGDRALDWYTCAIFTPPFVWLARRWPLERSRWLPRLAMWLAVSSIAVVLKYAIMYAVLVLFERNTRPLGTIIASSFIVESIAFWAMIAVIHAIEFYDRYREREEHATELRGQLAEARLEALSARLHPHFLFNTLQGISTLLHRDPAAADRMLTQLGALLRRSLERGLLPEVPLHEELDVVRDYIGIQQVRFGDRLAVKVEVEPGVHEFLVPYFVLQPLMENAIQHGIARRAGAGEIRIGAAIEGQRLRIAVTDNGPGLERPNEFPRDGIGLSSTRLRLKTLYGDDASLAVGPAPGGGFRAELSLPARRAAAA
jgi:two-component system, LytTR family, sensor kinase